MGAADRLNRGMLLVLGLLLTAGGVVGLLVGFGVFGDAVPGRPVFDNAAARFVGRNGTWLWPLFGLAGLVVTLLALLWLRAQLRTTTVGDLDLEQAGGGGRTELSSSAVTEALVGEVESYRGVRSASARLTGDDRDPDLALVVSLEDRADIAGVRRRVEAEAVSHVRQALDTPELPVRLDLRVTTRRGSRVQ